MTKNDKKYFCQKMTKKCGGTSPKMAKYEFFKINHFNRLIKKFRPD